MDSIDEFEFKPLSQGLGFHKKKEAEPRMGMGAGTTVASPSAASHPVTTTLKSNSASTANSTSKSTSALASTSASKSTEGLIVPPLPKKAYPGEKNKSIQQPMFPQTTRANPVDDILKTLHKNKNMSFESTSKEKNKISNTKTDTYKLSPWVFSTSILDGMLVTALTLLAMILVLVITKVDLIRVLTTATSDPSVYLATLLLFATMSFVYLFGLRLIMGATPGEWAYDLRIGNPQKQNTVDFALQVFARSLLVVLTGFVLFPLLSLIFRKDLLGHITGAALYKKN